MDETRYKYVCPRCHYATDRKNHLYTHLTKMKSCPPLHSEATRQAIIDELNAPKEFVCTFPGCTRSYSQVETMRRHRLTHEDDNADNIPDNIPDDIPDDIPDNIPDNTPDNTGHAYLITSPMVDLVKVSFNNTTIETLYDKHRTYFGDELDIYESEKCDRVSTEIVFKNMFEEYRLYPKKAFYDKTYHEYYKIIIRSLCGLSPEDMRELVTMCLTKNYAEPLEIIKKLPKLVFDHDVTQ